MDELINEDYDDFVHLLMMFYEEQGLLANKISFLEEGNISIGCDVRLPSLPYLLDFPFIHQVSGEEPYLEDFEALYEEAEKSSFEQQDIDNPWILPSRFVSSLQTTQLETLADALEFVFSDYASFPEPAKAAILDFYQHFGLKEGFYQNQDFTKTVESEDWQAAADLCHRPSVDEIRNTFTRQCFIASSSWQADDHLEQKNNFEEESESSTEEQELGDSDEISSEENSFEESAVEENDLVDDTSVDDPITEQEPLEPADKDEGSWEQRLIHELKHGEGVIEYMYCDTVGLVTVGVGCMLPDAETASQLPFIDRETGQAAQKEEIVTAYDAVKNSYTDNASARFYKDKTNLILNEGAIEAELHNKISGFVSRLKKHFPEFDEYPDNVKLGLVDMAYNLGVTGIVKKFPTFTKGVKDRDWQLCADQCRRKQVSQERNDLVKSLFETAA